MPEPRSSNIPGVWFIRRPLGEFVGAVAARRERAPFIDPAELAARITAYGITPAMCEKAREDGDLIVILVRGPLPSTSAELQDLYLAKLAGYAA
ncbi:hypothetical protein [Rathayibacter sp. VKM Ac-2630]|uniref:hypothetical protein n=1 Tax=Rathayibacter sp. VKM Ac-2630 TaxID=1938617 RepID=UPI0009819F44|nr:hypothetical protein [Rathayibacter sp. VKM Ac-2630]OOB90309.1 hypothetical protein B0T42_12475 [Rathayibacter sp. VKM Ac-2630]